MNNNSNVKFIQGTDVINTYLSDVRKYDVLSDEQERELLIKAKNGDRKAQDELILRNQRFVYSQAKIYATDENDIMDYVQEGNIGLMEALSQFDVEKDNKFLTYARWYIKQKMNRYMEETHDMIYQSNRQKYGKRIEKIKAEFLTNENRYPTIEEIMDRYEELYGETIKEKSDVYDLSVNSIDVNIDDDYTVEDTPDFAVRTASYNEYDEECEKNDEDEGSLAQELLSILPSKHSEMLKAYYGIGGEPCSIDELAEEYGMHPNVVKKLIDKSIKYIQENAELVTSKHAG